MIPPNEQYISRVAAGLSAIANRSADIHAASDNRSSAEIEAALENFMECVRYLNTRRSQGAKLSLESEADVQDALYLMLRPWVCDLVPESPGDKHANRFVIKDFVSESSRSIIEAKYIRDKDHGKRIAAEIHDDIEMYRKHHFCNTLIVFIYDPNTFIPDATALKAAMNIRRNYDGADFYVRLIVRP